jgi:rhamnose transport system substrate-binding protein
VFIIPKNLGNPYFTTADSVKSGGAMAALQTLGETATETSGTAATPSSQLPALQAAITKGANALIVSATDPSALCPTLKARHGQGHHGGHLRLRRPGVPEPVREPGLHRPDRDQ